MHLANKAAVDKEAALHAALMEKNCGLSLLQKVVALTANPWSGDLHLRCFGEWESLAVEKCLGWCVGFLNYRRETGLPLNRLMETGTHHGLLLR